jgi:hypothetical protein
MLYGRKSPGANDQEQVQRHITLTLPDTMKGRCKCLPITKTDLGGPLRLVRT